MTLPLIACLMPTKDRRDFATAAAEQFLAQDYAGPLELVIVDGSTNEQERRKLASLIVDPPRTDRRVTYVPEAPGRHTWGELINLARAAARAETELYAIWDDDNERAPGFIAALATALLAHPAAYWAALGRRQRVEVLPAHEWYLHRAPAFDSTLLIRSTAMPRFTDNGSAGRCLAACGVIVDRPDLFVFRLHGGNLTGQPDLPARFSWPRLASGDPALLPPGPTELVAPPIPGTGAMGAVR